MTSESSGTLSEFFHDGAQDDINYRDTNVHNVSVETGEVFSAEFTPKNAAKKGNQVRGDGFTIAQNDLVHEDLNGVLGIQRGSESGMEFSDFSPNNGYALRGYYRAHLDSMSSYAMEIPGKGQHRARFADESKGNRARPGSPLHASKSLHSFYPYNHSPEVLYNSFSGKMKFICSFGGRILPRPNDRRLRYVGGETKMISIPKDLTYNELVKKTTAICNHPHTIKYQLPGEDLDALISVTSDEDLHNMIEEFHDLERSSLRLRLFLVPPSDAESLCLQQTDADYQYVVAVNGMMEPGLPRNSSRENLASQISQCGNNLDYSQSCQRDTPPSFHPFERRNRTKAMNILVPKNPTAHWFNASSQTPPKSYLQSPPLSPPTGQFKDLKRSPNNFTSPDGHEFYSPYAVDKPQAAYDNSYNLGNSGYCYNHPSDAMPLSYYQKENTHLLESNKASEPFSQNRTFKRCMTFQPSYQNDLDCQMSVSKDIPLHSERLIHSRDINLLPSPRVGFQAKPSYGMHHAISDPQLLCEERYNVTSIETISPAPSNFSGEMSPSLEIFSTSPEMSMQWPELRDQKQLMTKNEHQKTLKEPEFNKEYAEWDPNSINWIKQKNAYSPQEGSYFGIKDICTPKAYGGRNSFNPLVSPSNSTTNCRENCNDPNTCWETTSKPQVSENRTFAPPPIREQCHDLNSSAKLFFVRPNETTNEKHAASGTTKNTEDGFCLSHELQPAYHMNSTDTSGFFLDSNDPRITDISFPNSASGAAFAQNVAIRGNISNGKLEEENCDRISNQNHDSGDEEFFEFQLSDNSHHCRVQEQRILGEGNANNTPPDAPLSSSVLSRVQDEPSDGLPPLGENRESESVPTKPAYKDDKVDGDSEGLSIGTNIEMEAGIYGFQIIRNSDLGELRELGSGTFGTVYHGKWRGTDVAIKMIKESCFAGRSSDQEQLTKDFWREAQILSKLHHPNVVAFYGVVPDGPGGTMATVTEYMANGSLRHVLVRKDRTLDKRKKLKIALAAAFGMEYLHTKNIVHFDLKCENLLVNLGDPQRPVCKVGDFGLSRIKRNTLVSGGVRGTLPWMAPELLNGNSSRVSEKVDVFSFGIAMWELLTGEEPYANMHCGAIIGGILNNTLRPPIPQQCDPEWRKLMEDCWSSDPAARPSFTEITGRLRAMSAALHPKTRARK
nr:serine/threonine-protein kinase BCK1/SLK1/SSP31-like [Ipomoea batatas]